MQLTVAFVVLLLVSLLSVLRPVVQARPQLWGIVSSWKGWHLSRRRHPVETVNPSFSSSSLPHQSTPTTTTSSTTTTTHNNNTLNYTAITILHVGNDQGSNKTDYAERSSTMMQIPQTGCLLLEYSITNETRIYNDNNKKPETTIVSSWGSKWMQGSSSSTSRSAWIAQSGNNNYNVNDDDDDDDDAFLALAQAAAMTSNVIVLVLHKTTSSSSSSSSSSWRLNPKIVQALQAGFVRRHEQAGLSKGSLLIVMNDDNNDASYSRGNNKQQHPDGDMEEWRCNLVLDDFQDIQPRHVYALEIITSGQDYELTLKNLLQEQQQVEQPGSHFDSLVPLQAFPQLLQQTFHSLLKKDSQQLETTAYSLFAHDDAGSTQCTSEQQDSSLFSTAVLPVVHDGGDTTKETPTSRLTAVYDVQAPVDMQKGGASSPTSTETITSTAMKIPAIATVDTTETNGSRIEVVVVDSTDQQGTTSQDGADLAVEQKDVVMNQSSLEQDEQEQAAKLLLATCHERLDALEQELEQVWFDATMDNDDGFMSLNDNNDDNNNNDSSSSSPAILLPQPSPCDFSKAATPILHDLQQAFATSLLSNKQLQDSVTANVGNRLSRLYQQHLQSLRDYHGKAYEAMLDNQVNQAENKRQHGPWWRQRPFSRKRRPINAARVEKELQRTVQAFRKAAQEAVPTLARRGNPFRDMDLDYVNALQGLLADMQEAIALRESLVDLDIDQDDDDDDTEKRAGGLWGFIRRGRQQGAAATWYEKLAARAFILSVNYIQGWLAWQALQRAALEREREMPKFPIF